MRDAGRGLSEGEKGFNNVNKHHSTRHQVQIKFFYRGELGPTLIFVLSLLLFERYEGLRIFILSCLYGGCQRRKASSVSCF